MPWWAQELIDLPTYQPPWVWLTLIAFLSIGFAPIAYHRFSPEGARYREAYLDKREYRARMANLAAEKYDNVYTFPTTADASAPLEVRARPRRQHDDGTVSQDAALIYRDQVTRFSYIVLSRSVWMKGKDDRFEGQAQDGVFIEDGLRHDYVEKLVAESERVVCIGLASAEPGPDDTRLADNRAFHLGRALFNINYIDTRRQIVRGISLGRANTDAEGATSAQRSVILVGIYNSRRIPRSEDVLSALDHLVQVDGVQIANYRRQSGGSRVYYRRIGPGPYEGAPEGIVRLREGENPLE